MSMKERFIEENCPEWQVDGSGMLVCPHGFLVEDDGKCREGCVSPLRKHGLI